MRRFTSLSAATALVLVVGLTLAPASQADEPAEAPEVTAPVLDDAAVRTAPAQAEASGLVVTTSRSAAGLRAAAADVAGGAVSIDGVTSGLDGTRVIGFEHDVSGDVAVRLAGELEQETGVTSVEPDYVLTAADAPPVSVNDPIFPQQLSLWDTTRPRGGYGTRAPAFWATTFGSPAVRVAVLDTGRTAHPDLTWSGGYDWVSNDSDPTDTGDYHGTHVAGIVAARANNGIGVAGVAPGVSVVPVRVLDGSGAGDQTTTAAGIYWAAGYTVNGVPPTNPVQVITMSLAGAGPCTSVLAGAVNAARSRGVVVIAAAGNNGADAAGYAPANCPGVISVGATDDNGARAPFSNGGSTVDISAPGVGVISTYAVSPTGNENVYARLSGTSMAAPAVAGAAALLASTGLSGAQIEQALPQRVSPSTTPGVAGILDLRPRTATKVSVKASASTIKKGKRVVLRVRLRSKPDAARPTGRIRVYDGKKVIRTVNVTARRGGNITVKTPRLKRKGTHKLRVVYLGEDVFSGSRSVIRKVKVR